MSRAHGSSRAYEKDRCRCDLCVTFQRKRVKANRADRLATGRLNHGIGSAYDAGCRCDACRAAHRRAYQAYRRNLPGEGH